MPPISPHQASGFDKTTPNSRTIPLHNELKLSLNLTNLGVLHFRPEAEGRYALLSPCLDVGVRSPLAQLGAIGQGGLGHGGRDLLPDPGPEEALSTPESCQARPPSKRSALGWEPGGNSRPKAGERREGCSRCCNAGT